MREDRSKCCTILLFLIQSSEAMRIKSEYRYDKQAIFDASKKKKKSHAAFFQKYIRGKRETAVKDKQIDKRKGK